MPAIWLVMTLASAAEPFDAPDVGDVGDAAPVDDVSGPAPSVPRSDRPEGADAVDTGASAEPPPRPDAPDAGDAEPHGPYDLPPVSPVVTSPWTGVVAGLETVAGPPAVRGRGFGPFIASLLGVAVAVMAAFATRRARRRLRPQGWLPTLLGGARVASWALAGVLGARAVWAVAPASWLPVLPWVALALVVLLLVAVAPVAVDLGAAAVVTVEGRVRPGQHVAVGEVSGVVDHVGARVTWLLDEDGTRLPVRNRRLLGRGVSVSTSRFPDVTVSVTVPGAIDGDLVRERLAEAAVLSPWRAPGSVPVVRRGEAAERWEITVAVLGHRFRDDHVDTVRELVLDGLGLDDRGELPEA